MHQVLSAMLGYAMSLAANLHTSALLAAREERLSEQLAQDDALLKNLASARPLREELRAACGELVRTRGQLGLTAQEEPLWELLDDGVFQADLAEWFMAGGIEEGAAVKDRLIRRMEAALATGHPSAEHIDFLRNDFFDAVDKVIFAHPTLAHWRHQLSLEYLREQVAVLRSYAEKAAGVYSAERQRQVVDHYCDRALAAWDIIDLSNLPEGDIHIATQQLLLRQLYMPLRIVVESSVRGEAGGVEAGGFEEERGVLRRGLYADTTPAKPSVFRPARVEAPVGERLAASQRLVVLGDPGGGKTTMLRWMATAYLLRHKGDDAFRQVPDTSTLPPQPWIPVLIRARDLGEADLCRGFTDFLTQHLNKTELLPDEVDVMRAAILDRIAKGQALLLVDGLDEIASPRVRMLFCQELERTAVRYPDAPIVVTSRIVGYRDMPYRMGSGFEHGVIAELSREDKDLFAQRWVEVTEQHHSAAERSRRAQELLDALHTNDRIEQLTGNPLLLTTLALVKRKVGKLPNRRTKLYAEAVSVLLNWNPSLYEAIEEEEALPQLEYIAYEMCRKGVPQLTEDAILGLLESVRTEYPNVRAIRQREPKAFLDLLEARSSILIKSGNIWQRNVAKPVWEFRHLTFQEYLAARALLDGRYPSRQKSLTLATQVAALASPAPEVEHRAPRSADQEQSEVPKAWGEALRLLVADCKDDDVDEVLLAILNPMPNEDVATAQRPRAVLAALCLADEPNVSEEAAQRVLTALAGQVGENDGGGPVLTSLDSAAVQVGGTIWAESLKRCVIAEFRRRPPETRGRAGGLWGMVEVAGWSRSGLAPNVALRGLVERLRSPDPIEALSAALAVMEAAFERKAAPTPGLVAALLAMIEKGKPERHAAVWALAWLSGAWREDPGGATWVPSEPESHALLGALGRTPDDEVSPRAYIVYSLGKAPKLEDVKIIIAQLNTPNEDLRRAVIETLGRLGNRDAVTSLAAMLAPSAESERRLIITALRRLGGRVAVQALASLLEDDDSDACAAAALAVLGNARGADELSRLLEYGSPKKREVAVGELALARGEPRELALVSRDLDSVGPWVDPKMPITAVRIAKAAQQMGIAVADVQALYEAIAAVYHLTLA